METRCEIRHEPGQYTLSVRSRTSMEHFPALIEKVYGDIARYLNAHDERFVGDPYAAYYNMDMQDLDVEIGMPVPRPMKGEGDIRPGEIPESRVATCIHVGPYETLEQSYRTLGAWVEKEGLEPQGVVYEFYLDDPAETDPDQLRTRIVFPVK